MKTTKLTINKTPERPEGTEIEVLTAESPTERRLLCYLITLYVRDAKHSRQLKVDVPDRFTVRYNDEGSFTLYSEPNAEGSQYYTPPAPRAVFLIRPIGERFEIGYAPVTPEQIQQARQRQQGGQRATASPGKKAPSAQAGPGAAAEASPDNPDVPREEPPAEHPPADAEGDNSDRT